VDRRAKPLAAGYLVVIPVVAMMGTTMALPVTIVSLRIAVGPGIAVAAITVRRVAVGPVNVRGVAILAIAVRRVAVSIGRVTVAGIAVAIVAAG
jgi:hypothetical protein